MFDFIRVETAPFFPHNCRACQSGKDLIDTHAEDHVGRVYLCRMCIERGARVYGMIEGNRHQQLMQADTLLLAANRALEQNQDAIQALEGQVDVLDNEYVAAVEELANARQRIEQLESAQLAFADQARALVGVGAQQPAAIYLRKEHDETEDEDNLDGGHAGTGGDPED